MSQSLFLALLVLVPLLVIGLAFAIVIWRGSLLKNSMNADEGFVSPPQLEQMVGRTGQALTVLRPGGMVLVDRRRFDARAQSEFIEKGMTVRVIGVDGAQLVVDDIDPAELDSSSD
jgi:membrane-bound serine protease (ClpP class)